MVNPQTLLLKVGNSRADGHRQDPARGKHLTVSTKHWCRYCRVIPLLALALEYTSLLAQHCIAVNFPACPCIAVYLPFNIGAASVMLV